MCWSWVDKHVNEHVMGSGTCGARSIVCTHATYNIILKEQYKQFYLKPRATFSFCCSSSKSQFALSDSCSLKKHLVLHNHGLSSKS